MNTDILQQFKLFVQWHVDSIAQARGYDSGATCVSYLNSSNAQWAAESSVFISWRDSIWLLTFQAIEPFESGTGELPSIQDFIASLPEIVWPS